jgi:hypothetical protein
MLYQNNDDILLSRLETSKLLKINLTSLWKKIGKLKKLWYWQ